MISGIARGVALAALMAAGTAAFAQESSENQVQTVTDWSVFEETDPSECWAVTTFKESVNTRDGRVVSVNRGDILLMVFFRPGAGIAGQVAFTGGYEFKKGSTVSMNIDGTDYELYPENDWAWPASAEEDRKIIAAMRRGTTAVLTAISERSGTTTRDTFSLLGFTAAMNDAERRCAS